MNDNEKYNMMTVNLLLRKNSEYKRNIHNLEKTIISLNKKINKLLADIDDLQLRVNELSNQIMKSNENKDQMEKQIQELERDKIHLINQLQNIYNSKTWQLNKLYDQIIGRTIIGSSVDRMVGFLLALTRGSASLKKGKNLSGKINNLLVKTKENTFSYIDRKKCEKQLNYILKEYTNQRGIIVFPPTVDWNIPLFQRPQHMAINLAKLGYLFFYCTSNQYDRVSGFEKVRENLYITNQFQLLKSKIQNGIIDIYSTSSGISVNEIDQFQKHNIIVYEYIDTIDETISGAHAHLLMQKHKNIKPDIVFASARKLYEEMIAVHGKHRVFYLPNGVEYEHFKSASKNIKPERIKPILSKNKPIVGYFGALASWIDYELLNKISELLDVELVLIGMDYDGSINKLKLNNNVHYLGVIPYNELPDYAVHFDVAIVPFKQGDIADTTSPIKIFEYMALGKPIVTTKMEECKNYKSIFVAENHDDFLQLVRKVLNLKDDNNYLTLLDEEARRNTWEARAQVFDEVVQKVMRKKFLK